jgi:ferric-dicitrate binding protein FerR (iron transport regulator)
LGAERLRAAGVAVLLGFVTVARASGGPAFEAGCDATSDVINECGLVRWDRGFLSFACARLGDVVAEYNQHAAVKLVLSDAELADALIGGAFRTEDPEAFTAGLRRIMPVRVERRGDVVWLMREAR